MDVRINKNDFTLIEIDAEYRDDFKCKSGYYSNFEAYALGWVADALAPEEPVFVDNNYWWDEYDERYSVYLTDNGIAVLMNHSDGHLYRIEYDKQ